MCSSRGDTLTQERVVGGDSVGPSVGPVVQERKEKDRQGVSGRIKG